MVCRRLTLKRAAALAFLGANERVAFGALEQGMAESCTEELEEHSSPYGFEETIECLKVAIRRAGLVLFITIDHADGARSAGLSMPPTSVLVYGHPKGGTPIMLAAPAAALELPLRVLVRQDSSQQTVIAFRPIAPMLMRLGLAPEVASRLQPAQRLLVDAMRSK